MSVDGGLPSVPVGPADRSAHPSALVGTAGEVATRPMATGGRISPASSQGDRGMRAGNIARLEAAADALPSSTGGSGLSFQMTRPSRPRGYAEKFCVPCNRRGAAHINGVCTMAWSHG